MQCTTKMVDWITVKMHLPFLLITNNRWIIDTILNLLVCYIRWENAPFGKTLHSL